MHLPLIDFRAYKVGDNIQKNMVLAPDAQESVVEYYWNFNVNGKEQIITNNGAYPDIKGDFIGVDTKIIKEADVPKIQDFSIETQDEDLTDYFLNEENLIMVVSYSLEHINRDCLDELKKVTDEAIKKGYTVIGLTASGEEAKKSIKEAYNLDFDFYLCDEKVLKTIVRSNPGVLKLNKGTVIQKLHYNDIDELKF
jgi:peroxiredoxin